MNNCWDFEVPMTDSASVAAVIFDSADDASLGEVSFMPFSPCGLTTGIDQAKASADPLTVYPNPAHGQVTIRSGHPLERYALYNAGGQLVRAGQWPTDRPLVINGLNTGLYLLKAHGQGAAYGKKIVVE
jgi:hypothetical protein